MRNIRSSVFFKVVTYRYSMSQGFASFAKMSEALDKRKELLG